MLSCSNLTTFPLFWAWERTWCTLFEYPFQLFAYVPPWLPFWLRWLPFAPRGYLCGSFKVLLWWVLALFWVTRAAHSVFGWRDLSYIVFFGVLLPP